MSANYHGIALALCFSKLLELCILMPFPDVFYTSDLQFGFKKGFSTDLCTGFCSLSHLGTSTKDQKFGVLC